MTRSTSNSIGVLLSSLVFAINVPLYAQPAAKEVAKPAATPPSPTQIFDAAVAKIIDEAKDIPEFDNPVKYPVVFSRPHPALSTLGPDSAVPAIRVMTTNITGRPVLDVYVRWHLIQVYKQARPLDRRDKGPDLVNLYKSVVDPDPIPLTYKEEYAYLPRDLWEEYKRLMTWPGPHGPVFTVGYPPFTRQVSGAAALAQMRPEQVAAYRKAVENANRIYEINKKKAAEILKRLKRVDFPENVLWNKRLYAAHIRVREMQYIARSLRAELLYEMLKTGDPRMLNAVGEMISKQLEKGSLVGFDLMAYVYLAAFDGVLELYSPEDLRIFANGMETIARRFNGYRQYSGHTRDFGDYAFTLIASLREGDHLIVDQAFLSEMTATPEPAPK